MNMNFSVPKTTFNAETYSKPGNIVRSLADVDFYTYTMMAVAWEKQPDAIGEYELNIRSADDLAPYFTEIRDEIHALENLEFENSHLQKLSHRAQWLKPSYIDFLKTFKLDPRKQVELRIDENNKLRIRVKGVWHKIMPLEIMILMILKEVRNRNLYPDLSLETYQENLFTKLKWVQEQVDLRELHDFKYMEFGTRRRPSFAIQKRSLETQMKMMPKHFVGTSNLHLALELDIPFLGTMAHQYMSAAQVLHPLATHQKDAMREWDEVFNGRLGVVLPDTISTDVFLKDFGYGEANRFSGSRQDSGCPREYANKFINHYKNLGINPETKRIIFSNSLDFNESLKLHEEFGDKIQVFAAMGTSLLNMFEGYVNSSGKQYSSLNAVIKLVRVNGKPVAKISDDAGKEVCEDPIYLAHLKNQFGLEFDKDTLIQHLMKAA
ncbi:nicotinate phosphoribosyltransferase [Vibrio vulnificus]|nr:nicotinate phosphoribosyltransferase [Vibrio vulnificus]